MTTPRFKVITHGDVERFEQRLNDFVASLDRDEEVVDVAFATSSAGDGVEYTALVQVQRIGSTT